jgi:hypothetical protein
MPRTSPSPQESSGTQNAPESDNKPWYQKLWAQITALLLLVATILAAVGAFMSGRGAEEAKPQRWKNNCPKSAPPTQTGDQVVAFVCYTWGTDGLPIGVFSYKGPGAKASHREKIDHFGEGQQLTVLCQIRNGRKIIDAPHGPRLAESKVWNKVINFKGKKVWVPDLYTNLPNKTGDRPPHGLPICDD